MIMWALFMIVGLIGYRFGETHYLGHLFGG
jgi:hypothetical protein